jgi:DNA-binding transcriptional regulator GbsR (MarR family)
LSNPTFDPYKLPHFVLSFSFPSYFNSFSSSSIQLLKEPLKAEFLILQLKRKEKKLKKRKKERKKGLEALIDHSKMVINWLARLPRLILLS